MSLTAVTSPTQFLSVGEVTFAYRTWGKPNTRPVVFLNHLAANLDNWDPAAIDLLAEERTVVTVDNAGVGRSSGSVPHTIEAMADDVAAFIHEFSAEPVDLLGLSMGGMVAQEVVLKHPELVRKLVLVGTGPRGGAGIDKVTSTTFRSMVSATFKRTDPKEFIFFGRDSAGKKAAGAYLERLKLRSTDQDKPIAVPAFMAQLKAIKAFSRPAADRLSEITQPSLVINGDNDIMVPSNLSEVLAEGIPQSEIEIYPNSGHGSLFQYPEQFALRVMKFLNQ